MTSKEALEKAKQLLILEKQAQDLSHKIYKYIRKNYLTEDDYWRDEYNAIENVHHSENIDNIETLIIYLSQGEDK